MGGNRPGRPRSFSGSDAIAWRAFCSWRDHPEIAYWLLVTRGGRAALLGRERRETCTTNAVRGSLGADSQATRTINVNRTSDFHILLATYSDKVFFDD